MKVGRIGALLRAPGVLAAAVCACLLLGFFFGGFSERRRSADVAAVAAAPAEELVLTRSAPAEKVNINTADEAELQTLPGIGPALAARIVAYREEHGGFRYLYELTDVKGIGSSTYEGLRELITLD